ARAAPTPRQARSRLAPSCRTSKVLRELIATVLRCQDAARGIERNAFAVAKTRREALGRGELLICSIGVVTPDSRARFQLGTWLNAWRVCHAIRDLTRVGGRAQVDVERALRIDCERMSRMIAGERQSGNDDFGRRSRRD